MKSSKSAATLKKPAQKRATSTSSAKKRGESLPPVENVTPVGTETPLSTKRRDDASKGIRQEQKRLEPGKTTIVTHLDVGYGNALFIRGSGAGLTWEQGQAMECLGPNEWMWQADNDIEPLEFKLLINDEIWSQGENLTASPGERLVCNPEF